MAMAAHACTCASQSDDRYAVYGREIKKRENIVFTESSTIREILYLRKFPAIRYLYGKEV